MGITAIDNQVKKLSNLKADKEGHCADVFSDALFLFSVRRRCEAQAHSVCKLFSLLLDNLIEFSFNSCIITADRGYRTDEFMKLMSEFGLGSVLVM